MSFNLKRAVELATQKYDAYLVARGNPDSLYASCAYGELPSDDATPARYIKFAAPPTIMDFFRDFFYPRNLVYYTEGAFLVVDKKALAELGLTAADEQLFLHGINDASISAKEQPDEPVARIALH